MNDLRDTVELMLSDDYKDRFKAEYYQTKIRHEKLQIVIAGYDDDTIEVEEPICDVNLLKAQSTCMGNYLYYLEIRANEEGIELYPSD